MTLLIESFEEKRYAMKASTPQSRLRTLMQEHAISKAHAKKLAALFHVPADLFL